MPIKAHSALPLGLLLLATAVASSPIRAQTKKPVTSKPTAKAAPASNKGLPADSILAGITKRGRDISDYDFAAWHGSDALATTTLDPSQVTHYIARKTAKGWTVGFGHLNEARDAFLLMAEATSGGDAKTNAGYTIAVKPKPVVDTGFFKHAALAIDVASAAFGKVERPYNTAVLPAGKGQFWVYLMPAQVTSNVWPLGADVRFLISADGRSVVSRRQLHNTIIEYNPNKIAADGGKVVESMHNALVNDIPEDTDVFHVLNRFPRVPEVIVSKSFVFRVEIDGTVKCLGRSEDVIKK